MKSQRKILRVAASALLAVALVAGGLEVGEGEQPQAHAAPMPKPYWNPGEMPAFPGSLEYPLGENLGVNGMPMRISHFSSTQTAEQVRDFYLDELSRRDLSPSVQRTSDGGYSVSASLPEEGSQMTVVIAPRGKGVDVFPSILPLNAEPTVAGVADADLPFSKTAVGLMRVSDGIAGAGVVTWQEPALQPAAVLQHLRDEMGRRSWNIDQDTRKVEKGSSVISFRRGSRRATFTVSSYGGGAYGAAVVAQFAGQEEE